MVGGSVPQRCGHRERDPRSHRRARPYRGLNRRRDPQLLGASARPEDRHDPGPDEQHHTHRRAPGPLPGAVRRVLRPAAREHGVLRDRPTGVGVRRVDGARGLARRRPDGGRGRERDAAAPELQLRRVPHDLGHACRGRAGTGLHPRRVTADDRGRHPHEHAGEPGSLDPRPAGVQARRGDATLAAHAGGGPRGRRVPGDADLMASYAERLEAVWGEEPGLASWIGTVDHKRIGMRYLYTGFICFAIAGAEAVVMRLQLARPELSLVSPETYDRLFTMHGVTMMFLFATPVLSGFGNYMVPLMIGARDMAFPRLNAFGYWVFLGAGVFLTSAFLVGQAPNDGWFNYAPLASSAFTPDHAIDFYALGLIFIGVSTIVGAINFIITAFKCRAPGMSLNRIPIFVWGEIAFAFTVVFALPALTIANVFLELDRKFGFHFYDAPGGDPVLWQHLFWFFGHPEVYLVVLPAMGIVAEIIAVFSRKKLFGYRTIVYTAVATGVISFFVWAHHQFVAGIDPRLASLFTITTLIISVPIAEMVFCYIATLFGGSITLATPMLWALSFVAEFLIGGVTGIFL